MNKKIKIALSSIILMGITFFLIYPIYINNSVEKTIKKYYEVIDNSKDVNIYNSLVVKDIKLEDLNSRPNIIEKRDLLEIKEIDAKDYELIQNDLIRGRYSDKPKDYKFYMIKYDVKFKDGAVTPVDSGIYYIVHALEKENGKWLINGGMYNASFKDNKLFIED